MSNKNYRLLKKRIIGSTKLMRLAITDSAPDRLLKWKQNSQNLRTQHHSLLLQRRGKIQLMESPCRRKNSVFFSYAFRSLRFVPPVKYHVSFSRINPIESVRHSIALDKILIPEGFKAAPDN